MALQREQRERVGILVDIMFGRSWDIYKDDPCRIITSISGTVFSIVLVENEKAPPNLRITLAESKQYEILEPGKAKHAVFAVYSFLWIPNERCNAEPVNVGGALKPNYCYTIHDERVYPSQMFAMPLGLLLRDKASGHNGLYFVEYGNPFKLNRVRMSDPGSAIYLMNADSCGRGRVAIVTVDRHLHVYQFIQRIGAHAQWELVKQNQLLLCGEGNPINVQFFYPKMSIPGPNSGAKVDTDACSSSSCVDNSGGDKIGECKAKSLLNEAQSKDGCAEMVEHVWDVDRQKWWVVVVYDEEEDDEREERGDEEEDDEREERKHDEKEAYKRGIRLDLVTHDEVDVSEYWEDRMGDASTFFPCVHPKSKNAYVFSDSAFVQRFDVDFGGEIVTTNPEYKYRVAINQEVSDDGTIVRFRSDIIGHVALHPSAEVAFVNHDDFIGKCLHMVDLRHPEIHKKTTLTTRGDLEVGKDVRSFCFSLRDPNTLFVLRCNGNVDVFGVRDSLRHLLERDPATTLFANDEEEKEHYAVIEKDFLSGPYITDTCEKDQDALYPYISREGTVAMLMRGSAPLDFCVRTTSTTLSDEDASSKIIWRSLVHGDVPIYWYRETEAMKHHDLICKHGGHVPFVLYMVAEKGARPQNIVKVLNLEEGDLIVHETSGRIYIVNPDHTIQYHRTKRIEEH